MNSAALVQWAIKKLHLEEDDKIYLTHAVFLKGGC